MENIHIQPVRTPDQIRQVAQLADEIWPEYYTPIIGREQAVYMLETMQSQKAIEKQLQDGDTYYLARVEDGPVGYMSLRYDPATMHMQLSKIYIREQMRGRAIGRAMLNLAVARSRQIQAVRLWLTVNRHNGSAIAFYQRMGFMRIASQVRDIGKGFVMDDEVLALPL